MDNPAFKADNIAMPLTRLPHGPSFRFLHEIVELTPGKAIIAWYRLRGDEDFFSGHFPGRPMLPAVIMVEMLAQAAGVACQTDPVIPVLDDLRLSAIRSVKVHGTAIPGELVTITVAITGRMGNLVQAAGKVEAQGHIIAEGQVTLSGSANGEENKSIAEAATLIA